MRRLRIAMIGHLSTPLPPKHYGGIQRVLCTVSDELHARGHEVTIFGPDEIESECRTLSFGPVSSELAKETLRERFRLWSLLNRYWRQFDVIHDMFRVLYMMPVLPRPVAKLISFQCPIPARTVRWANIMSQHKAHYCVCGAHMLNQLGAEVDRSKWHVVHNPIDLEPYRMRLEPDREKPYLAFLSRLCEIKGAHRAIEVARRTGRRLVIAGNIQAGDQVYFDTQVKPGIDGVQVRYIGPVDDAGKNELLGGAEAMLFPLSWEEPFGLVVGEAMACGTPVLAFRRGAMPEIIQDGVNGYLSTTVEEMCGDVEKIKLLDRATCRTSVERRFSPGVITDKYEEVYRRILSGEPAAAYSPQPAGA